MTRHMVPDGRHDEASAAQEAPDTSPRQFVEDLLRFYGGSLTDLGGGVYDAAFSQGLGKRLGRRKMKVRFDKGPAGRQAKTERLIAGNPFLEEMLAFAQESGAVTRRYWSGKSVDPEPGLGKKVRFRNLKPVIRTGRKLYFLWIAFYFRLTLSSEEIAEKPVTVYYDAFTRRVLETAHPAWDLPDWSDQPAGDLSSARGKNYSDVFNQVIKVLQDRVGPDVSEFRRRALSVFENEAKRFSQYYKELISEEREKLRSLSGGRRAGAGDSAERMVQYKVDWERKLSHEARRVEPRASVRLVAAEELYVPVTKVDLSWTIGNQRFKASWGHDHARDDIAGNLCQSCGLEMRETWSCASGHLVCARCHKICSLCGAELR